MLAEAGDGKGVIFALTLEETLADELFDGVTDKSQGLAGQDAEIRIMLMAPFGDLVGERTF